MPDDNRRELRLECTAVVDLFSPQEADLGQSLANLSAGGACVRAATAAPVGTEVMLLVEIGSDPPLELEGEVVWSDSRGPCEMGVRFTSLTPEVRARLQAWLQSRRG